MLWLGPPGDNTVVSALGLAAHGGESEYLTCGDWGTVPTSTVGLEREEDYACAHVFGDCREDGCLLGFVYALLLNCPAIKGTQPQQWRVLGSNVRWTIHWGAR